jgi:predicted dinucleotide-binding enzyme
VSERHKEAVMRVAVIGSGNVGKALATAAVPRGHAVPWASVPDVAADLGSHVDGVAVVDATNPLLPDYSAIAVQEGSGAEEVQRLLPGAAVVKAINTVPASRIVDPVVDGVPLDGYVAGDDAGAKAKVTSCWGALGCGRSMSARCRRPSPWSAWPSCTSG